MLRIPTGICLVGAGELGWGGGGVSSAIISVNIIKSTTTTKQNVNITFE